MLPDLKVSALITQQIPACKAGGRTIISTISLFAAHTQQLIKQHQFAEVKQCFSMAGVLYHNGSALLRTAIESVFLFGISPLVDAHHLKDMLPAPLQQLRYKQIQSII